MLCPDCAKQMSGYGRKEYDRGAKCWRDIWFCSSEKKWWERRWNGEWIRRFDLEEAEEAGACQTQTRCPVLLLSDGVNTLPHLPLAAYKWFIFRTILEVAKNERKAVGRVELHELG